MLNNLALILAMTAVNTQRVCAGPGSLAAGGGQERRLQQTWTLNLNDFDQELKKLEDYLTSDQFEQDVN